MEKGAVYDHVCISDWNGKGECSGNSAGAVDVRAIAFSSSDCRAMERYSASGICVGPRWPVDGVEADHQSLDHYDRVPTAVLENQYDRAGRISRRRFAWRRR